MSEEILTIDEMKQKYDSEWILVGDPEVDEHLKVKRGKILFHSKTRDELDRKEMELRPEHAAYVYTGKTPKGVIFVL